MTDNFDSFTGPSNIEAFQFLKINIQNLMEDKSLKTILVTSALPAEGKSFTVANLAVAMAYSGKRVIIVDFNLRQPQQQLKHIHQSRLFPCLTKTGICADAEKAGHTSPGYCFQDVYDFLQEFGQIINYKLPDRNKQPYQETFRVLTDDHYYAGSISP